MFLKKSFFLPVINKPPLGQRELPLVYLQQREKPGHMTWECWYEYANENFLVKQQAEMKQEELKCEQCEDEEKMADALTMDFFSDENFSFNGNGMALMGTNSKGIDQNPDNLCSTTTSNGSVMNKKMETEVELANKTLDLTKNLQDVILEVSELILDPDFVFCYA